LSRWSPRVNPEGRLNVIGMGSQDSRGLKKGVVVNIEETVHTISRVMQEVELMADCKVKDVYTGIAGSHIKSFNSNGMVAIKDKEVTPMDVERVIETARAMPIPADQEILHILTQEFIIDGQDGIREPIGMSGLRLEVKVHIVTGAVSAAQNIVKCVRRCGLEVNDLVLQPLASSYAVLSEDEKDLGVCLIDIGGGTTDHRGVDAGGDPPYLGDSDCRRPDHQRHRHGAAHADARSRGHQVQVRLRPVATGRCPKTCWTWPGSTTGRAQAVAPGAGRCHPAARRGALRTDPGELRRSGFEEVLSSGIVLTGGAGHAGHDRAGRGNLPHAGAPGRSEVHRALADVVQSPRFSTAFGLLLEAQTQRKRGLKVRKRAT
jgi:cell division protein FtsA